MAWRKQDEVRVRVTVGVGDGVWIEFGVGVRVRPTLDGARLHGEVRDMGAEPDVPQKRLGHLTLWRQRWRTVATCHGFIWLGTEKLKRTFCRRSTKQVGTPAFMAPEMAHGSDMSETVDVYSFG